MISVQTNIDVFTKAFNHYSINKQSDVFVKKITSDLKEKFKTESFPFNFTQNEWNFRPLVKYLNKSAMILNFNCRNKEIINYLKLFAIYQLTTCKVTTVATNLQKIKSTLDNITSLKNISILQVENFDLIDYYKFKNISIDNQLRHNISLFKFYSFISNSLKLKCSLDITKLIKDKKEQLKIVSQISTNKTPLITKDLFNIIENKLTGFIENSSNLFRDRVIAGAILIQMQTGLRSNEILSLQRDCIKLKKIDDKEIYFLEYNQLKSIRNDYEQHFNSTICTKKCKVVIDKLNSILSTVKSGSNFLIDPNDKFYVPISVNRYVDLYKKVLVKACGHELLKKHEGTVETSINGLVYNIPQPKQFRVYFCTELYRQNFPLTVIESLLGHISAHEMQGYYIRSTNSELLNATKNVMDNILNKKLTLLGGANATIFQNKIQELKNTFEINPSEIKVEDSTDDLINKLSKEFVIKSKAGGFCIKKASSQTNCINEKLTNKLLCATGICPNAYHFFYNIFTTYQDFQSVRAVYTNLISRGQIRAAECEYNKLVDICERRLLPELKELKKELKTNGKDIVLSDYPELKEIVNNIQEIESEAKQWKKM